METWNRTKGLEKIGRYCAYQERCHAEVRQKLRDMGAPWEDAEEILVQLILDGFLDEERFARAYVRGKFRNNGWGKIRIRMELKAREIGEKLAEKALKEEIDPEDYFKAALDLARKKKGTLRDSDQFVVSRKMEAYLQQKGFEWETIRAVTAELEAEKE